MVNVALHRPRVFGYLSLFTSLSTLLCCALPSLLVLFGLGATVASFLSAAPWLWDRFLSGSDSSGRVDGREGLLNQTA